MSDLVQTLRLNLVPGVGPRLRRALFERFSSAEAILAAAPSELRQVPGIGAKLSQAIATAHRTIDAEKEIELCREHDIEILLESDERYPRVLREIPNPPGVLFLRGQLLPQDAMAIAIVGSRHSTQYGLTQSERLAGSLARAGLTIVSGLARGIDAAAHRGALAAGGRTIAVLGSGLLNVYPPEHKPLAEEIASRGAVLSEVPVRAEPLGGVFPQRNRIISGLSLGVVVVEAAVGSGALSTAKHATEQSREVFAVPGRVDSRMSRGCHRLIRDGAKLVETADDVLEELPPLVQATTKADGQTIHHPAELLLNELEQQVLAAIDSAPTLIDQVVAASGLPTPQVLSTLSVLEMRRVIRRVSGSSVMRI
jgi:DNA processing protein